MKNAREIVDLPGIGPVLLERSSKARRVSITVRPSVGVRVAVPKRLSRARALDFVYKKSAWINKHLAELELARERHLAFSEARYLTQRAACVDMLKQRTEELSREHGLPYRSVSVREQKTRWGSCSAANNISLNIKLTRLPSELVDYIIIHELVHTRVKSHGRRFHSAVADIIENGAELEARMKEYYLDFL